jgi:hypothetical protein
VDDNKTGTPISGATGATYSVTMSEPGKSSYYYVIVTNTVDNNGLKTASAASATALVANAAPPPDVSWYSDEGTNFTISTAPELAGFAELVNAGNNFEGKTVTLAADIDLSFYGAASVAFNGGNGWIPIGNIIIDYNSKDSAGKVDTVGTFNGTFDGGGKKVTNLYINSGKSWVGLFGSIRGATIRNLVIENANVRGGEWTGGIAGSMTDGSAANCYIENADVKGGRWAGGIVGIMTGGSVANCYVADTKVDGGGYVGGVVGNMTSGAVTGCYFSGTVSGPKGSDIGGVVGYLNNATVANCFSAGDVIGDNTFATGGIAGRVSGGGIANCYSASAVIGMHVGGIAGSLQVGSASSIANSAALNPVVRSERNVGRVTSDYGSGGTFANNVAFADMAVSDDGFSGGASAGADENLNGAPVSAEALLTAAFWKNTMGWPESVWTFADGKLPGLFGKPVNPPSHLQPTVSALSHNRAIPPIIPDQKTVWADGNRPAFFVGPNPVSKSTQAVGFFRQGKWVDKGTLTVYDASGNVVRKITISDNTIGNQSRRPVGSWDLRDAGGRPVSEGTYLVRGMLKTSGGKREKVSLILGVR